MIADKESAKSRKKQKAGGTMDIKDICNAGGDILDAVADAVNRNDYSGLSENVTNTVNRVVRQVRDDASKGTYGNPTHQYAKHGQAGNRNRLRHVKINSFRQP